MFYREISTDGTEEGRYDAMEHAGQEMNEEVEKRRSAINELTDNPSMIRFARGMKDAYREPCGGSIVCLVVHAIAHGVMIGMEMERAEYPRFEEE